MHREYKKNKSSIEKPTIKRKIVKNQHTYRKSNIQKSFIKVKNKNEPYSFFLSTSSGTRQFTFSPFFRKGFLVKGFL